MNVPVATFLLLAALVAPLSAAVQTKEITYRAGDAELKGYLAWDDAISGPRPGVIVVHEWWGLNDYARRRARQLAELGYTAFAADMFGDGKVAAHPKEAGEFVAAVARDPQAAIARFLAAEAVLKAQPTVDPKKIAAIGYCFGGGIVLNMARQNIGNLAAVATFHGALGGLLPVKPPIRARVLVCHGGADAFAPADVVEKFRTEMQGPNFKFLVYPGAKHGFTNPAADDAAKTFGLDVAYDADADKKSWAELEKFLRAAFAD